jgi:hypothetical protein
VRVKDAFPSKYLCGEDLDGRAVTVTIEKIVKQRMPARAGIPASDEWVMFFAGKKKGLILRRKLARQVWKIFGTDEMNEWFGRQITLYPETIKIAGEQMVTIRARAAGCNPAPDEPETSGAQPGEADVGKIRDQVAER